MMDRTGSDISDADERTRLICSYFPADDNAPPEEKAPMSMTHARDTMSSLPMSWTDTITLE